jgi:hypothetical protein
MAHLPHCFSRYSTGKSVCVRLPILESSDKTWQILGITRKFFIFPIVPKFGTGIATLLLSLLVLGFLGVHQKGRRIDRVSQGFAALFFVFCCDDQKSN